MMTIMKEIDIPCGCTITQAYEDMQRFYNKFKRPCFCMFNETKLLSSYSLDKCYKMLTGLTKDEYDEKRRRENEEYAKELAEYKASIPQKIVEFREKAAGLIQDEYMDYWNKIVPSRLNDCYRGLELECTLDIVKELNKPLPDEEKFVKAKEVFEKQGHSGTSGRLVLSILANVHPLGKSFAYLVLDP